MDTITIKIEGRDNVSFFLKLIEKFNFIKEIRVNKQKKKEIKITENLPIERAVGVPSIDDFSGIWADNPVTLQDIRDKAWKRN